MNAIWRNDDLEIPFYPETDLESGVFVVLGSLVGITKATFEAGQCASLTLRGIFHNVAKHNVANALTKGQKVWLNPTTGKIHNASAAGYICVGYALDAAGATDATCKLLLRPTGEVGASS
ncbi:MAG: DUF2190 family protein [Planctomycetia bacterium]|nr:DUF2190 family protein [Planctomycetia bacterium]